MLEKLLRELLIPVVVGIAACSSPSDNSSGCLVDSDCLSGRYCRKEAGKEYGVCAFHEDIIEDVSPEVIACGNSVCEEGENCTSCALDCGDCKQLCQPCEGDYQCGDGRDRCINFKYNSLFYNNNSFCSKDCSLEECPFGYKCSDIFIERIKKVEKQCLPKKASGVPLCVTDNFCEKGYNRKCEAGALYYCNEEINKVSVADCEHYGLACGFSNYYNENVCHGFSKFGEPCPEWFDCNEGSEADNCVGVGGINYCTKKCNTLTDCPSGFSCETISSGEKVCVRLD
ncbi:MAG: hypothetical protein AABX04_06055 [Nanoarchaeota archaeon]